ncbi:MAG: orotidine 5'-phosphate decarboxylase / HUMPS family protein, partial [Chloroflexota bacterium]
PGAGDLQDLSFTTGDQHGIPLYEHVAHLAQEWNTADNIGLVVGATQPEALLRVRKAAPDAWLLVPGVGVQGADLETALKCGLREDGKGMLISVSRSLSRAEDVRRAAAELRDDMVEIKNRMDHD